MQIIRALYGASDLESYRQPALDGQTRCSVGCQSAAGDDVRECTTVDVVS